MQLFQSVHDYVYGFRDGENAYILFRRVLYPVMEWIADQSAAGHIPTQSEIARELDARWSEVKFKDSQFSDLFRRNAESITSDFAARMTPGKRVQMRQKRTVVVEGETIEITVDEIEEGSPPIFRVHKFGKPAKTHKDQSLLALLPLVESEQGAPEVRLHYPQTGQEESCESRSKFNGLRRAKMKQHVANIAQGRFAPNPGEQCAACPYNLICPA